MEIRVSPDGTQYAIKTGSSVTLPWFIGNPDAGGSYGSGNEAAEWQPLIPDPSWQPPAVPEPATPAAPPPDQAPEFIA